MARKINLPIDYIVFQTDYVDRIVNPERKKTRISCLKL